MSSSEGENFGFDDDASDSEGYAAHQEAQSDHRGSRPRRPPRRRSSSTATTPTTTARTTRRTTMSQGHPPANDKPLPVGKNKTASEKYTKLSQIEHILKRPDSYIGSVETHTQLMWTHDDETKRMVYREIIDEILVNAADHKINDKNMDTLKVEINVEEGTISVYNNGHGIPIEMHSTEKCYIPELIFGHLLAGSNFDDDEKKLTGWSLANIYSHEFTVETADRKTSQKYKQTWTDNMGVCGKAKITKNAKGEEWTKITFRPDLKRFGMAAIDDDTASLLRKRVYDMAGTIKDVKVYYNDKRITDVKNFQQYVKLYLSSAEAAAGDAGGGAAAKQAVIFERIDNRWEVGFAVSEGTFQQVAGTHVALMADQIAKKILEAIGKKNKGATVKAPQIKNHMWIFVNALIENPTFDSQTKDTLTLTASKFGTKPSPIIENILHWAQHKADLQSKKTDGAKRSRLTGYPKLADANNAGTKYAKDCTLILTEGDSAKTLAIAGLSVVGRDNFGVFPLRGKLLNVREARHDQIMKNEEIQAIKKIMGLQHNKDYTSTATLRYGRLMIMADQDHDGSHIKGLIINFLDHFYPSLLKLNEFLVEFVTPIVRVTKGKQRKDFFTVPEYEQWNEETPDAARWDVKYYKGLGTSKDADARDYFSHMEKHMIPFASTQEGDRELIDLAFSKKKAGRPQGPGTYLDHRLEEIPYSEFINKELILFSMADNIRSIPSVADGFKPGQRKVMWGCFKRNMRKEVKVAQLVGYIGEHAAYHHGELSLAATIINLAQTYVGSNNINLLEPNGQYGTRDQGGKDHASARYINTLPTRIARVIYHPLDDALLTQQKDDNQVVEPEFYMPIVPMVLINGAEGIGTGWSTNIPCFNPEDIVANLRRLMADEEMVPMHPWWRGFRGEIKQTAKNKYDVVGVVKRLSNTSVEITELPIHKWTQNYKVELESMIAGKENEEGTIKEYKEHHDTENVHFIVTMDAKQLEKAEEKGLVEFFKLTSKINTTNMMCFDFDSKIKKYNSPEEIIEDFYPMRLAYYQKRKVTNQARFVKMIVDKELVVSNRKKVDIVADLKSLKFRPFPKIIKAREAGEEEEALEEADVGNASDYDYLLGMAISSLTREKIDKLLQTAQEKEDELLALLQLSPKQMWNTDLDKFMAEWEAYQREMEKKQTVLKTRKSIGRRAASDSEDEFRPIKAPAKRKAPEPKRPKPAAKDDDDDDDDNDDDMPPPPPKRKAPAKTAAKDEDDSDVEMPPPKKKAPAKKAAKDDSDSEVEVVKRAPKKAAKKAVASDSDDGRASKRQGEGQSSSEAQEVHLDAEIDSDDDEPPKKKKTPPAQPAHEPASPPKKAAPKKVVDSSDDEMDYDAVPVAPVRTAPSRPARAAPKKYVEILSDDDDEATGDASMFVDDD
ncbi:type II DNA topoisomerase [Mycena rebaudengoi]|nr:type II DNA topoisomerase [Mycena rebaudengoi]